MLYFDRIDASEGIDVKKTSASKGGDICHYWYLLNYRLKFQANVCNRCHDLLIMYTKLCDIAVLNIKRSDYHCIMNLISKNEATGRSYGQTKGPARHEETWWWKDGVSNSVSEKQKLWKEWEQGNTCMENYLEAKKKARRTVYQAKWKAEKNRFGNIRPRDYQKYDVFKTAKRVVKTNQGFIS